LLANPEVTEGNIDVHGFKFGWVYVNDKFIGVFELPCKVPVLVTGQSKIQVFPTIENNGMGGVKKVCPFMDYYETTVELKANEVATVEPTTKYKTGTTFWIEDFEGGNIKLSPGSNSNTNILVETEPTNRVGKVFLNGSASLWTAYTDEAQPFNFPIGSQIYLELECKNEAKLKTTFIYAKTDGTITQQYNISVTTATEGWKKVYIELTELIIKSGGYAFWVGFEYELPSDQSESTLLIDNIKVIYR